MSIPGNDFVGIGFVIRSSLGHILGAGIERFPGHFAFDITEVITVRQSLIFTRDIGISKVVMDCDSKRVIDLLSSTKLDDSYFGVVIKNCLNLRFFF